jgi:hypothetical protein
LAFYLLSFTLSDLSQPKVVASARFIIPADYVIACAENRQGSTQESWMVRQQRQSRLGIFSLEVVKTYRANRKPDGASERSICFFASLDFVDPVRSD